MYNGEHSLFDELGLNSQSAGTPTWYYITATPMVRMNFDPGNVNAITDVKQMLVFILIQQMVFLLLS